MERIIQPYNSEWMQSATDMNGTTSNNGVATIRVKRPEYANCILILYEGVNVGPIYFSDIVDGGFTGDAPSLKKGGFFVLEKKENVKESINNGVIKFFTDITKFNNDPPLKMYNLQYIF
jgi:hypothetical protein